jgi:integrase
MTAASLTNASVKRLEPRERDYIEWCGKLPGFGVRVWPRSSKSPDGRKVFVTQYRAKGSTGAPRKVTIGTFPTMTADEARKQATQILAKAQSGEDVAAARAKRRGIPTMSELCDEYLEHGLGDKKASTIATDKGRIERHIKPLLGRKRVDQIDKADVQGFLKAVADGKTAVDLKMDTGSRVIVKGGKGTATRTLRLLGAIFTYAVDQGYIASNPKAGVTGYKDARKERWLSDSELQRLGDALREAETGGLPWQFNDGVKAKHRAKADNAREKLDPYAIAAIRLLLLTGCRAGEILNLQWAHVDLERGYLNLPDSKTGKKDMPLNAPAKKVLADLPRVKGNPFVIVGTVPGARRSDLKRPWKRLTDYAGLSGLRIHDLRHGFASVGAASGMGLYVVGKLLGHSSPSTTQRYAHIDNDPLKNASEAIAQKIAGALGGFESKDNVVELSGAR